MSRLVAYMGSDPERLQAVLQEHRELMQATPISAADTVTSVGVGFYQGGEVLLQRRPRLTGPIDLYDGLKDLRTDVFLIQIQPGVPSNLAKNENTPPFRFRSWIMATHGEIAGFEGMQEDVLQKIPDFLRRNIRGQTPGEYLFHLYLTALYEAGRGHLEDANLPPEITLRALHGAMARLLSVAQQHKAPALGPLHVALTNGRSLVVLRHGADPLWVRRLASMPGTERHHEHLRGVLIFGGAPPEPTPAVSDQAPAKQAAPSTPTSAVGMDEVPDGHAVLIGRDLAPRIVPAA